MLLATFYQQRLLTNHAKEHVEQLLRTQRDVFSFTFHELRNPLNAASGGIELTLQNTSALRALVHSLKATDCRPELRKRLIAKIAEVEAETNEALQACFHTLDVINGVLDVAKLEDMQSATLSSDEIYLNDFLRETCMIPKRLAKPGVQIIFETPEETSNPQFRSCRRLLKQVLINLLSNAVKFTNSGFVLLRATFTEEPVLMLKDGASSVNRTREGNELQIEVQDDPYSDNKEDKVMYLQMCVFDTGPGVPPESIAKLFQKWAQLSKESSPTTSDLQLKQSKPGFKIANGSGLGLLISKRMITALGGVIEVFSPWYSSTPSEIRPSADLLYDTHCAGLETERTGACFAVEIPIRLVSEPNFRVQLDSPVRHCDDSNSNLETAVAVSYDKYRNVNLVVIDDEGPNRRILTKKFQVLMKRHNLQWRIDQFPTGESALEVLCQMAPPSRRDMRIFFVDFNLSRAGGVLDGLSILEEIRALEETQQAEYKSCCIIWTGNCSAEDQANYLTAGFDACIGKPLPPIDELGARIFHLLDVTYDPSRCLRRAPQSTNTVDCGLAATRASVSTRDARTVTSSFESELVSTLQQFWFDYVECQRLEVGHLLYQNFFNQHPEHVEIFTRRKGRSNLKSVAVSSRRAALFMHMLSSTVLSMHDFDTLAERATRIASTHVKYGIPLDAYFDFLEAIESALQSKLPSHFTRSVRFAFRVAFSRIAASVFSSFLQLFCRLLT
ncbi:MAG: hypothetical protein MHM6MM_005581 [Cercozoa sp. M6MM]